MENNSAVYPVVRWGISQSAQHQIGLVRLEYLTQPGQATDKASTSPIFGFSPQQLRALAQALTQAADQLEAAAPKTLKN